MNTKKLQFLIGFLISIGLITVFWILHKKPASVTAATALVDSNQQYEQLQNQYKILQLQRKLLDEQVAIAASKEKIAELNAKTSELSNNETENTPNSNQNMNLISDNSAPTASNEADYKLVYLDHQGNDWSATLNNNGQFEVVNIGSQLADGSEVTAIDQNGVILKNGEKITKLAFENNESENSAVKNNLDSIPQQQTPLPDNQDKSKNKTLKNWQHF